MQLYEFINSSKIELLKRMRAYLAWKKLIKTQLCKVLPKIFNNTHDQTNFMSDCGIFNG